MPQNLESFSSEEQGLTMSSLKHNFISNILCTMSYLLVVFYARWRISISVLCFSSLCWLDRGKSWPDLQVERSITMKTAMKENIKRVGNILWHKGFRLKNKLYQHLTPIHLEAVGETSECQGQELIRQVQFKMHHSLIIRELKIFPVNINVWVNTFH